MYPQPVFAPFDLELPSCWGRKYPQCGWVPWFFGFDVQCWKISP